MESRSPSELSSQDLEHMSNVQTIRPVPSKSADNKQQSVSTISPEKSTSLTLSKRRNHIPASLVLKNAAEEQRFWTPEQQDLVQDVVDKLLPLEAGISLESLEEWKSLLENPMDVDKRLELLDRDISQEQCSTIWTALSQPTLKTQILYDSLVKETGPFDKVIDKEKKDETMARLLKAYALYDVSVGYHSSLASLVQPLIESKMPESQMFAVFVRLMETYDMRTLYMLNMEGLQVLLQQFQTLLATTCPTVEDHLHTLSITPAMYASSWFLTLFQTSHVMRLFTLVFLQGAVQTSIRAAVWILKSNAEHILKLDNKKDVLHFLSQPHLLSEQNLHQLLTIDISTLDLSLQIPRKAKKKSNSSVILLKQQLEDVVLSLSRLQKDYKTLAEEKKTLCMREMDGEAAQRKLAKRNAVLEKRVKKYKTKLATLSATPLCKPEEEEEETESFKRQEQFNSFVDSLRDTGEFGALIAGALAPTQEETVELLAVSEPAVVTEENQKKLDSALQNVTSELVAVKLDHFETCQRYQSLLVHCQDLTAQINTMQESQQALCQKVIYLESELEDVVTERDGIYADQEEVLALAMVAKKTSAELQLEKMALVKEVEKLEANIADLQLEKQAFFMPRDSFSEEVFAAHTILFPKQQKTTTTKESRRHTMQITTSSDEYRNKFVESELRCRELEKYLAETKVRLAEFESSVVPRGSLQRTASVVMNKRNSTASLSMLANRNRRESTESYASSTTSLTSLSSNYNSKRSSVYSKIWNTFSPPATPTNVTSNINMLKAPNMMLCQDPQII